MKAKRIRATKHQLHRLAVSAICLLASTVFTSDRVLTPRQKAGRRRLLRQAPKVLG